jgi:hypothetical protein
MAILQGTMSDGTLIPVQADSQGRLVCEGLQGVPGPEGPQGPPGPPGPAAEWPPNPKNGDVLAWDNGPVWVSGVIPVGPPWVSDALISVTNDLLLTFASDKNFDFFEAGYTLAQTADHVPTSSVITAVNESSADYSSSGIISGAGFQSSYPVQNMFDGSTSTFAYTLDGFTTFTFASPIPFSTLRVYSGFSSSPSGFQINGIDGLPVNNAAWTDYTNELNGEKVLRSIRTRLVSGSYGCYVYAIEVDGQILNDSTLLTELTVLDASDLANFRSGDSVTAGNGGSASGVLGSISGTTLTLASSSGTWASSETVVGPTTTPPSGVVDSVDKTNKQILLQSSDAGGLRRWAVGVGMTVSTSGVLYGATYKAHR